MNLAKLAESYNEEQIQELHMFLMENYQGQLDEKLSPVENAIRIMKEENDD